MRNIIPFLLLWVVWQAQAQVHDFDSLYEHVPVFREQISQWQESYDLFEEEDPLQVTIRSDFKYLVKKKRQQEYQPALLEMQINDTVVIRRDVKIKPRGVMRLKTCYYPPIMVNFPKKEVMIDHLREFDKLKLVQLCKKGEAYEQYVISEYYIYKLYNLISPFSLRVRLLKITYIDTSGKQKERTNYAFFIEDIEQLAGRMNCVEVKMDHLNFLQIDRMEADRMYIFQYLIGNTDFSIPGRHNVKLIKVNDIKRPKPIAVPYDFDYAGMVNAFYAVPTEGLPIEIVRERFFLGNCRTKAEYSPVVDYFNEKKAAIYQLYREADHMDENNKKQSIGYLDEFFEMIEDPDRALRYFTLNCRN